MRIYVLSNNVVKKKIALLEPYLQETRQICYIWSVNGLLQIENNKIYKIKIKDVPTKKTLLGAFPATIDESEFIRKEECYQVLPIAHKEYTTLKIYRVKGSTLTNPTRPLPSPALTILGRRRWGLQPSVRRGGAKPPRSNSYINFETTLMQGFCHSLYRNYYLCKQNSAGKS